MFGIEYDFEEINNFSLDKIRKSKRKGGGRSRAAFQWGGQSMSLVENMLLYPVQAGKMSGPRDFFANAGSSETQAWAKSRARVTMPLLATIEPYYSHLTTCVTVLLGLTKILR